MLGAVNLFVALFNFVLLPLDGGRGGRVLRGGETGFRSPSRPTRSRPIDTARLLPVAYVVGGIILISGVVLILADIFDPIQLF